MLALEAKNEEHSSLGWESVLSHTVCSDTAQGEGCRAKLAPETNRQRCWFPTNFALYDALSGNEAGKCVTDRTPRHSRDFALRGTRHQQSTGRDEPGDLIEGQTLEKVQHGNPPPCPVRNQHVNP